MDKKSENLRFIRLKMHQHSQIQVLPKNYQKHNTKNNNSNNKSNKCSKEQNNHNKNNNFNRITRENSFIVGQPNNKNKSNNIDFKAKRDKNMGMSRNDCQNHRRCQDCAIFVPKTQIFFLGSGNCLEI